MVSLISQWGHKNGAYEYVIDTLSDLENVPTDVAVGTVVFCIENSKTYMLNGSGIYVEVNFKKGGKGGDKKLGSKEIYENGVYRAENDELDGFAQVEVEVANSYVASDEGKVVDNGVLVAQSSQTVTQNNTYDTTLINSMTVNVPSSSETIIGINPTDGNEYYVETDNNNYLVETLLPSRIEVVTPPTKTTYTDGETVDITDMVVKAYSRDNNLWNSTGYIGGVIPHSELTIEPTIAHGSGVSTDEWNVRGIGLNEPIYMKEIYVGMTFEGEEGVTGSRYITEMENTSPVYMIQFDRGDNQKDHLYVSLEYFRVRSRRVCPSSWDAN